MLPNDILYFKKVPFKTIKTNDLIVIKKRETFAHKVIYRQEKYLITRGNNNTISDGEIYPDQIIGKIYKIRRGNSIIDIEDTYLIQSTQYFQEIVKTKHVLEKENIDFIFLKGLPIHLFYEKYHPRRIYVVCDVLIDKRDDEKSKKIFERFNYKKRYYFILKFINY